MRLIHLLPLVPLVAAAPSRPIGDTVPELAVEEWASVQSGFFGSIAKWNKVADWTWGKAEQVIDNLEQEYEGEGYGDGEEELTIWQQLNADPNSFSKLVKIIKFEEKAIKYLDDKDSQITFFAPNNDALTPPKHHHHGDDHDAALFELAKNPSLTSISALLDSPAFIAALDERHDHGHGHHGDHGDHDHDDKKKKEIIKYIIGKVLQYHGLTKAYTAQEIAENSTIPTALKADDGSYGGLHRRIKVEKQLLPPAVKLSFYAKVLTSDKKARNGYLHTLDHPLIPPGSIFESAYLLPDFYSTLTSAVQHLHGQHYLDWQYDREHSEPGKPKFHGTGLATLFAPTNVAFGLLPPELKFYLFSPFGSRALKKIIAYHYIPDTLLLTELLVDNRKHDHKHHDKSEVNVESVQFFDEPTFHKEFDIHPALPNSTLHIEVAKVKVLPVEGATKFTLKVNGQSAIAVDAPARNGAFHAIGKLLVPPHHHHDEHGEDISSIDSYENWEQWLPAWANEA